MRRILVILLVLLTLASPTGAADAAELRFPITYRSAATIYIGGGSADGLAAGERLTVKSKDEILGEIEITFLSEHSASCRILRETRPLRVGDTAVIARAADHAATAAPEVTVSDTAPKAGPVPDRPGATAATPNAPRPTKDVTRYRGAVSLGWNRSWDDTERHYDYEQRQGRLDVSAWGIGGQPLTFTARARSRQDLRPATLGFEGLPRDERRDSLYELALRYEPGRGRALIEAGRLGVPLLGLGYVDGISAEARAFGSLRLGGFFGRRADLYAIPGFDTGNTYGGWLRLSDGGGTVPGAWDASVYGVREFSSDVISREFLGLQSRFGRRRFTVSQWAEVDLLRDWRSPATGGRTQLSNLSASANYRPAPSTSLGVSYDQRKNYRTAETRSVPEVLFDTYVHQGFRGSIDIARASGLGGSIFAGMRKQDRQSDTAYSGGAGLRHPGLTGAKIGVSLDGYYFSNGFTSGLQTGARVGKNGPRLSLDLSYGLARYTLKGGGPRRQNQWYRLSAHRTFGGGLWIQAEAQLDRGDDTRGPRGGFEFGYRF